MKKLIGSIILWLGLIAFTSQAKLLTSWKVQEDEYMLLEDNLKTPQLFNECPKNNPKCQSCYKLSEYNLYESFKRILNNRQLGDKYYCFYRITDNDEMNKIKNASPIVEEFDSKNDLVFEYGDLCNSYCIQAVGKKCGKFSDNGLLWILKSNDFQYCHEAGKAPKIVVKDNRANPSVPVIIRLNDSPKVTKLR